MPQITTLPKIQFFDNALKPAAGCHLHVAAEGTDDPLPTWQNAAQTIFNTAPVVLDARGECTMWIDPAAPYKLTLRRPDGALVWESDENAPEAGQATPPASYTHFRLNILQVHGMGTGVAMDNWAFFDEDGALIPLAGADGSVCTASASDYYAPANYTPIKAFDNNAGAGQLWYSLVPMPTWLQLQFNTPRIVSRMELVGYAVTTRPRFFTVEASNNGTDWTVLKSVNSLSWTDPVAATPYPITFS